MEGNRQSQSAGSRDRKHIVLLTTTTNQGKRRERCAGAGCFQLKGSTWRKFRLIRIRISCDYRIIWCLVARGMAYAAPPEAVTSG